MFLIDASIDHELTPPVVAKSVSKVARKNDGQYFASA
jgi:hypothetical protein